MDRFKHPPQLIVLSPPGAVAEVALAGLFEERGEENLQDGGIDVLPDIEDCIHHLAHPRMLYHHIPHRNAFNNATSIAAAALIQYFDRCHCDDTMPMTSRG